MKSRRRTALLLAALFLLALGLLLPGAHPGMASDDSPETALVAATLSVGHPPGYPLHALLGRLAYLGLPGGGVLRLNLLAAALMSLAAALAAWLALAWARGGGIQGAPFAAAGLATAALCLADPEWTLQAGQAKGGVFGLSLCLGLGMLLSLSLARPRLAFLLMGLGLSHHYPTFALFLPAAALLAPKPGLSGLAWALPGLSLWAYLPLRAAQEPFLSWGAIHSWNAFFHHIARADYLAQAGDAPAYGALDAFRVAGLALGRDFPRPALLLALAGAAWAVLKLRRQAAAGLAWLAMAWPVAAYAAYEPQNLGQLGLAMQAPRIALALLAGLGAAWACAALGRPALRLAAALGLSLALAWHGAGRASARGHGWDFYQEDASARLAQSLPRGAVLVAGYDADLFGIWCLQALRGRRPDVSATSLEMFRVPWMQARLRRGDPAAFPPGLDDLRNFIAYNFGRRPVMLSRRPGPAYRMDWVNLAPLGTGWLALPEGRPPRLKDGGARQRALWASLALRSKPPAPDLKTAFRSLNPQAAAAAGMARLLGRGPEAEWWLAQARYLRPEAAP